MEIKSYDCLPGEAAAIRKEVFMDEQGFVSEFDGSDDAAHHLVLFDEMPMAIAANGGRS